MNLAKKLLAHGGDRVSKQPDLAYNVRKVCERGQCWDQPVTVCKGESRECHGNSAKLWAKDPKRTQLVTGYALSDACWIQHTWVIQAGKLIETTFPFQQYFGYVMNELEALHFAMSNCPELQSRPTKAMLGMIAVLQQRMRTEPKKVQAELDV